MPKLTEEDLAKLYPRAKSYDELQEERIQREIERKPRFVTIKLALWASLSVPAIYILYRLAVPSIESIKIGSTTSVLSGVCFMILWILLGAAVLFYLRSQIDDLASKTIAATPLFYLLLISIFLLAGLGFSPVQQYLQSEILAVAAVTTFVFSTAALTTLYLLKLE